MDCQHLDDVYEIYLLGGLAGEVCEELETHVREECPRCLHALREAAESVYWLVQNSAPARPRPTVKARLKERLTLGSIRGAAVRKARPSTRSSARGGK
ncbi:MAG TPA: hypothetical protein VL523_02010 [Terriglobia bacterium]|nr:hypothetical protein [Terriglobia bacterium]